MSRPLVTYTIHLGRYQSIVATTTKKAAREAFEISRRAFDLYASDTANEGDIATATAQPGQVFSRPNRSYNLPWEPADRAKV